MAMRREARGRELLEDIAVGSPGNEGRDTPEEEPV
jgi:hypothetical protein